MRLIVLGAAAGGGFPQWNSACPVGRRAWQRDPAARWRTQCSVALSADGERWTLLNASPDLRQQILATPALHPRRGPRHSPIAAVVLTNGDVDHVAGLLSSAREPAFALYATGAILGCWRAIRFSTCSIPSSSARRPDARPAGRARRRRRRSCRSPCPARWRSIWRATRRRSAPRPGTRSGSRCAPRQRRARFFIPGCARLTPALAGAAARRGAGPLRRHAVDRRRDDPQRDRGEDRRAHGSHEHLRAGRHARRVCAARLGARSSSTSTTPTRFCSRIRPSGPRSRRPAGRWPTTAWRSAVTRMLSAEELEAALRQIGEERYH